MRLAYDPSDGCCDGDANLIECRECGDHYDGGEFESCPVCWQGEGVPPTPDAVPQRIEDAPTVKVRTPTDAELRREMQIRRLEEVVDEEVDYARRSRAIQALKALSEEQEETR